MSAAAALVVGEAIGGTAGVCRSGRTVSRTPPFRRVCHDERVPPRVLIVDDHASFRASARAILEEDGFDVVGEAATGAEAIAAVDGIAPEIVILDVQLPDLSGFDVCAACLTGSPADPAIVLVSSRDVDEYGSLVAQSGARGFVAKADLTADAVVALLR